MALSTVSAAIKRLQRAELSWLRSDWRIERSPMIQRSAIRKSDANFTAFVIGEANSGLLKYFLYFEDRGEVSFHYPFILLDALKRRQADPGAAGKLTLAPAQERPRCPYLRRISHDWNVYDSISLDHLSILSYFHSLSSYNVSKTRSSEPMPEHHLGRRDERASGNRTSSGGPDLEAKRVLATRPTQVKGIG